MNSDANVKPRRKRTVKRIITAVVVVLVLLFGAALVWQAAHAPDALEKSVRAELGQLEGKSNEEIEEALNRVVEEGYMNISINVNPTFVNGKLEGTLQIENGPANKYDQYVTITRDDTGEIIYVSGLLPPNHHIQEDVLLVDLDAGDYPCTATFTAYDEEQNEVGMASARITVTVLS